MLCRFKMLAVGDSNDIKVIGSRDKKLNIVEYWREIPHVEMCII